VSGEPMTSGWYYSKAGASVGQQAGPFSWEQLVSLAQAGAISPTDLVWNPSLPQWLPAAHVVGLIQTAAQWHAPPAAAAQQPRPGHPSAAGGGQRGSWLKWALPLTVLLLAGAAVGLYFGLRGDGDGAAVTADGETLTTAVTTVSSDMVTTTAAALSLSAAWTNLDPSGESPGERYSFEMAYASKVGKVILFGGAMGRPPGAGSTIDQEWLIINLNDTWAYDPVANTWTNLNPAGAVPDARRGYSMAYDSAGGKVILFGGTAGLTDLNDTWAYDPVANTWTILNPAGDVPPARGCGTMVYDSATSKVILFGGAYYSEDPGAPVYLDDTWVYDPVANTWTNLNPAGQAPSARCWQTMVYDPAGGKALLFGGEFVSKESSFVWFDDTWAYDPAANTWTNLNPAGALPTARSQHSMIYDEGLGKAIVYGGFDDPTRTSVNDAWAYDPVANTWTEFNLTGDLPLARNGHTAVWDPATGKMIMFGGLGEEYIPRETWALGR
jgi:N-acetylneuraminic acid mutarotase